MKLTVEENRAIALARRRLAESLAGESGFTGKRFAPIAIAAVVSAFADLVEACDTSPALLGTVNHQLRQTGLQITPRSVQHR